MSHHLSPPVPSLVQQTSSIHRHDHVEQSILAVREARSLYESERQECVLLRQALQQKEGEVNSAWEIIQQERRKSAALSEQLARVSADLDEHRGLVDNFERNSKAALSESGTLALENQRLKVQLKQASDERAKVKELADSRARELATLSVAKVKLDQQCGKLQSELTALRAQHQTLAETRSRAERQADVDKAAMRDSLQDLRDTLAVTQAKLLSKERDAHVLREARDSLAAQVTERDAEVARLTTRLAEAQLQLSQGEGARAAKLNDSLAATERRVAELSQLLDEKSVHQMTVIGEAADRLQVLNERVLELEVETKQLQHQCETLKADNKQLQLANHFATSKAKLLQEALESNAAELERLRSDTALSEDAARGDALLVEGLQQQLRREQERAAVVERDLSRLRDSAAEQAKGLVFSRATADVLTEEKRALAVELQSTTERAQNLSREVAALHGRVTEMQRELIDCRAKCDADVLAARSAQSSSSGDAEVLRARVEAASREKETVARLHAQQLDDIARRHAEEVALLRNERAEAAAAVAAEHEAECSKLTREMTAHQKHLKDARGEIETLTSKASALEVTVKEQQARIVTLETSVRDAEMKAAEETARLTLQIKALDREKQLAVNEHEKELANERRAMESLKHHHDLDIRRAEMERVSLERQHEHDLALLRQELAAAQKEALAERERVLRDEHDRELMRQLERVRAAADRERTETIEQLTRSKQQLKDELEQIRRNDESSVAAASKTIMELHDELDRVKAALSQRDFEARRVAAEREQLEARHRSELESVARQREADSRRQRAESERTSQTIQFLFELVIGETCGAEALLRDSIEVHEGRTRDHIASLASAARSRLVADATKDSGADQLRARAEAAETAAQLQRSRCDTLAAEAEREQSRARELEQALVRNAADSDKLRDRVASLEEQVKRLEGADAIAGSRNTLLELIWELYSKTVATRRTLRAAFQSACWRTLVERRLIEDDLGNGLCSVVEGVQWSHDRLHWMITELFTDDEKRHVGTSPHFFRGGHPSPAAHKPWNREPSPVPARGQLQSPRRQNNN